MLDRKTLRVPAVLLLGGFISYVLVTFLHTGGPANDHHVIFGDYADSHDWVGVHVAQFVAMAVLVAGLLALSRALRASAGSASRLTRFSAVMSAVALGLYGVLQAVDGVALKQAVDAWENAPAADRAARFASAETVRWLEWGTRSYHSFSLGLAVVTLGAVVALSRQLPRTLGVLISVSGVAYLAQGWALANGGFSDENSAAILIGYVLLAAWTGWITVLAWRAPADRQPLRPAQLSREQARSAHPATSRRSW